MKAVTIVQPIAQLFLIGEKNLFVTGGDNDFRGPIAIVAGDTKLPLYQFKYIAQALMYDSSIHHERSIVGIGELEDVQPVVDIVHQMRRSERHTNEEERIESSYGRYGYWIRKVQPIAPIPVGETDIDKEGLWLLPEELAEKAEGAFAQLENINRGSHSPKHSGTNTPPPWVADDVDGEGSSGLLNEDLGV
jgi:hypothetical protein